MRRIVNYFLKCSKKWNEWIIRRRFLKKLFLTYVNLHPSIRERILYKDIFLRIEETIRKKKEINIYYKEKLEKIKPISFERNKDIGDYNALKAKIENKEYLFVMKEIEYVT